MRKFDLVLFDFDGTFADTSHDMIAALNRVRQAESLPDMPYDLLRPHVSGGTPALIGLGFDLTPSDPQYEGLRQKFLGYYEQDLCRHTALFPDIADILESCRNTEVKWGIVTNKPEHMTVQILRDMEVEGAACVIGGDTLEKRKPHPEPVLHACEIAGVAPGATVMIGDAERDIASARAAGVRSIAVTYGYIPSDEDPGNWGAEILVHSPSEIRRHLWA